MSKAKKLTFGMIAADMKKELSTIEYEYEGANGKHTITIRKRLSLADAMSFVSGIAGACVNMDEGIYNPGAFDFALRMSVLIYYAGFSAPDMNDTNAIAKAYDVVYGTKLFDRVIEIIDYMQYHDLVEAATAKVEYMCNCMASTQASKMNELIAKMDEVMTDGGEIMRQLSGGEFQEKVAELTKLAEINNGQRTVDKIENTTVIPFPTGGDK